MKHSFFKIFIFLFVPIVLLMIILLPVILQYNTIKYRANSQTTDIYITNSNKILVKQTIDVRNCIPENKTVNKIMDLIFYSPICSSSNL